MPASARWCVGSRLMSCPLKVIVPLRTGSSPMMLSMVVVLPAPLRPTSTTDSASRTISETPLRTWAGPRKVLIRSSSSMVLHAQEIGGDLLVVPDLVRGAVGQDRALVHGDDPRAVLEDNVHVVLDDDGRDPPRAHHLRDDVHDGRLLAGADTAGGLVEEEELGAERVGHGDVQQLAFALAEPARYHPRLARQAELLEHRHGLVPDGSVRVRQREQLPRLAVPREDSQREVVERAEIVEEVDELEAPGDASGDLLVDGLARDVRPLEHDGAKVHGNEPADQVDQRGLPCPVGADEGQHLSLRHGEVHAVHGVRLAEVLGELRCRQQGAHALALPLSHSRFAVPTMPPGRASTSTTSTTPRNICQYTV